MFKILNLAVFTILTSFSTNALSWETLGANNTWQTVNIDNIETIDTVGEDMLTETDGQNVITHNGLVANMAENNNGIMTHVAENNNMIVTLQSANNNTQLVDNVDKNNNSITTNVTKNNSKIAELMKSNNDIMTAMVESNNKMAKAASEMKNGEQNFYIKILGSLSLKQNRTVKDYQNQFFQTISPSEIRLSNTGGKNFGLRFVFGIKKNILNRRFFISPEIFGTYFTTKEVRTETSFVRKVTDRSEPTLGYIGDDIFCLEQSTIAIKGLLGGSVRFGINLFDDLLLLYVKPNLGVSILKAKISSGVHGQYGDKRYGLMAGAGIGIDVNIARYIMLTAELDYDVLPYKFGYKNKGIYFNGTLKMLTLNFGIGFKF